MTLTRLRRKLKLPKLTGHVINMWEHTTWGDNLYWFDCPDKREGSTAWKLGTHAVRIPEVGDEIRCRMESGRVGRWVVTAVERFRDPRDMFFADCTPLGYVTAAALSPVSGSPEARASETEWQRRTRRERERAEYINAHGNVCELCGNPPKSRGLSEDHDHKTGKHRGWLCYRCNRALPTYVDALWLGKALAYMLKAEQA